MRPKPYKRKPGELELRVLKDGRLVMIAPDEAILEIGRVVEGPDEPEAADPSRPDGEQEGPTDQQTLG